MKRTTKMKRTKKRTTMKNSFWPTQASKKPLRWHLPAIMLIASLALSCAATEEDGETCPAITQPDGLLHGYECTSNEDCLYGVCDLDALVTGGSFGICTKACGTCAGGECSADNDSSLGLSFTCIRPKDMGSLCVPQCNQLSDCTALSPKYTDCSLTPPNYPNGTIGVQKFCIATP